jgi:crossover junction endodeoxyribonuclease RuvC
MIKNREIRSCKIARFSVRKDKIILGIDPGTVLMGYGLVEVKNTQISMIHCDVIALGKIDDHSLRLRKIFDEVTSIIDQHKPDELAIEAPFFGKNVQSMLKLGRAQGVAIAAALQRQIPIAEYSPKKIKQSITGNGNASKEQVAAMLQTLLNFSEMPKYLDATDALGAAVCHYFQGNGRSGDSKKTYSGWKSFLSENPTRRA